MPEDFSHKSGVPNAFDRGPLRPNFAGVVFPEGRIVQGAELNEIQTILKRRQTRAANMVARDGDRISGAEVLVNVAAGSVSLTPGQIYVQGDVRTIAGAVLTLVPMTGNISLGVRLVSSTVYSTTDTALVGLMPGSLAQGEPGAEREVEAVSWGFEGDGQSGQLYSVYLLKDGVVIDQTPPPQTSGITAQIAQYDSAAHGNYVVSGCQVSPLGVLAGQNVFSIGAGEANILGFKRTRQHDLRYARTLDPDNQVITAEPQTFADGGTGTATILVAHAPIATVTGVIAEKLTSETVTHGAITGSLDALSRNSVTQIVSVVQGGTTYVPTTDYIRTGDKVDWTPAGAEPAPGATYTVTYRYLALIPAGVGGYSSTATTVTITGGVTGGQVFLSYTWSLPRVDLICLDQSGLPAYVAGVSSPVTPVAPICPSSLLPLAVVTNTWNGAPTVEQAGIKSISFAEFKRWLDLLFNLDDLVALERLKRDVDYREPVLKKGIFVDPFNDDTYRDAGTVQTAAVGNGYMALAVDTLPNRMTMSGPVMLDYTDEIIVRQDLYSLCFPINPYQSFSPLPGELSLTPRDDFWTDFASSYTSPATINSTGVTNSVTTVDTVLTDITTNIQFLRQIPVSFTIRNFAANEQLTYLTFDGINVLPGGTPTADATGTLTGTFTIPALVKAGTKIVHAEGSAGTVAEARFTGQGTLETVIRKLTTTITSQPIVLPLVTAPAITQRNNRTGGRTEFTDPVSQTFSLTEGRYVTGINLKFCAAGNRGKSVFVELRTVENGTPTGTILAQSIVDMTSVVLNAWTTCRLKAPVWINGNTSYAWVVKTDDAVHAVAVAKLGDADIVTGKRIAGQPYTVGVFLSSSNAQTWTPQQDIDLTMQILGAVFAPTTKTFNFGNVSVVNMSDLMIRCLSETPTVDGVLYFEIERQNGQIIQLSNYQPYQFNEFVNEAVKFRAVLRGTRNVSPILYPGVTMLIGTIRTSGNYISRFFNLGTAIRLTNYVKSLLPSGSTFLIECNDGSGVWTPMPFVSQDVLNGGWLEKRSEKNPYTAVQGRVRVTLTGGPAARPLLSDFRCLVV